MRGDIMNFCDGSTFTRRMVVFCPGVIKTVFCGETSAMKLSSGS